MALSAARAPIPPTALIGREGEIARVRELLGENRLVTLTGPGGMGKTRLALAVLAEVESEYRDGVAFVDLVPLADPEPVASAIAGVLGVQEAPGRPLTETLEASLGRRELLLCLDNFEHLLEAAPFVARLLSAAAGLRVLATSRAPLRLAGEQEHGVPPLDSEEAHQLFVVRARQAKSPPTRRMRRHHEGTFRVGRGAARPRGEVGLPQIREMASYPSPPGVPATRRGGRSWGRRRARVGGWP
jgi:hypothetical protein